jgi:hypothetical protein
VISTTMAGVLAQSRTSPGEVIAWSVGILILLVVAMAAAARLKRRIKQEDAPAPALGFTLSDLRQMHRAGQLTDEEFNRAKEKIVAASQAAAERVPAPATGVDAARDSADAIRARRLARDAQRPGLRPPAVGGPGGGAAEDNGDTDTGGTAGERPVT